MVAITPEFLARNNSEDGHQSALFCYAQEAEKLDYRWGLLYSIPNGGKRGAATASRMKATGSKRGFPDVGLPVACWHPAGRPGAGQFHGLYLELKRLSTETQTAGKLADAQKYWRGALQGQYYAVETCYGWEHTVRTIESYLNAVDIANAS